MPSDIWKPPSPNPKPWNAVFGSGSVRWPAGRGGTFDLCKKIKPYIVHNTHRCLCIQLTVDLLLWCCLVHTMESLYLYWWQPCTLDIVDVTVLFQAIDANMANKINDHTNWLLPPLPCPSKCYTRTLNHLVLNSYRRLSLYLLFQCFVFLRFSPFRWRWIHSWVPKVSEHLQNLQVPAQILWPFSSLENCNVWIFILWHHTSPVQKTTQKKKIEMKIKYLSCVYRWNATNTVLIYIWKLYFSFNNNCNTTAPMKTIKTKQNTR